MTLTEMTLTGAVMILFVTLLRALSVSKLPKRVFTVMWELTILRLLLPISVPLPILPAVETPAVTSQAVLPDVSFENVLPEIITPPAVTAPSSLPALTVPAEAPAFSLNISLKTVWTAGMILAAMFFAAGYALSIRKFRNSKPTDDEFIASWLTAHPLRRPISVCLCAEIDSPLTYGFLNPVILLPKSMDLADKQQLGYILEHEYAHIQSFDALKKLIAALALCIHWFNPLVWAAYFLYNRDIELLCDEKVIRKFGTDSRSEYARILVGIEEQRSASAPLLSHFGKNSVEERIVSIMKFKKATVITIAAAALLVAAITVTVIATSINPVPKKGEPLASGDLQVEEVLPEEDIPTENDSAPEDNDVYERIIAKQEELIAKLAEILREAKKDDFAIDNFDLEVTGIEGRRADCVLLADWTNSDPEIGSERLETKVAVVVDLLGNINLYYPIYNQSQTGDGDYISTLVPFEEFFLGEPEKATFKLDVYIDPATGAKLYKTPYGTVCAPIDPADEEIFSSTEVGYEMTGAEFYEWACKEHERIMKLKDGKPFYDTEAGEYIAYNAHVDPNDEWASESGYDYEFGELLLAAGGMATPNFEKDVEIVFNVYGIAATDYDADEIEAKIQEIIRQKARAEYLGDLEEGSFLWPVPGYWTITSSYGSRWGTAHRGIDISGSGIMGADITAANSGVVILVSNTCTHNYSKSRSCGCGGGFGNYCIIDHGGGYLTLYGNAAQITVSEGQNVTAGDVIGTVGSTGDSTGAHLHFEVRVDGDRVDPQKFNLIKYEYGTVSPNPSAVTELLTGGSLYPIFADSIYKDGAVYTESNVYGDETYYGTYLEKGAKAVVIINLGAIDLDNSTITDFFDNHKIYSAVEFRDTKSCYKLTNRMLKYDISGNAYLQSLFEAPADGIYSFHSVNLGRKGVDENVPFSNHWIQLQNSDDDDDKVSFALSENEHGTFTFHGDEAEDLEPLYS